MSQAVDCSLSWHSTFCPAHWEHRLIQKRRHVLSHDVEESMLTFCCSLHMAADLSLANSDGANGRWRRWQAHAREKDLQRKTVGLSHRWVQSCCSSKQKQRIRIRAKWTSESTGSTAVQAHVQSTILGLSSEGGRKEKKIRPEFKVEDRFLLRLAQRKSLLFSQHLPGTDGCF